MADRFEVAAVTDPIDLEDATGVGAIDRSKESLWASDSLADSAISLRGISKRYGRERALAPTTLDIHEGEFFCLLGPSGSGKTTALNLIGGFVRPSAGEIRIGGRAVNGVPPYKRPVNTVFQSYALFPHMSVRDNVLFGLRMAKIPTGEARDRSDQVMELVRLEEYANRFPSELSGGQQQRVAVARALVNRPFVLLLDEPLGALDLKLRQTLQLELARIHKEIRTTFVYVTHDQGEAMALADRIAVMHEGRIHQIGTPEDVYLRPQSHFVAQFIGESNLLDVTHDMEDAWVVLEDGTKVPCATAFRGGAARSGTIMVRPESVQMGRLPPGDKGFIRGTVVDLAFLGAVSRAAVDCPGLGGSLIATLSNRTQGRDAVSQGDEVFMWWDPEDAVLLASSSEETD